MDGEAIAIRVAASEKARDFGLAEDLDEKAFRALFKDSDSFHFGLHTIVPSSLKPIWMTLVAPMSGNRCFGGV